MARTTHGIKKIEFSTDGTSWTELTNISADESTITHPDQENNPVSPEGNNYPGEQYTAFDVQVLDDTNASTVYSNWNSLTEQYFRFTLSNSATWTFDYGILLQQCKPIDIEGRIQGRSDGWQITGQIPYDDITKA